MSELVDWLRKSVPAEDSTGATSGLVHGDFRIDNLLFHPSEKSIEFSTKKTWEFLRPRDTIKPWAKAVWFKNRVPKHAFNFWAANLDRLPVKTRLASWGINISTTCLLCSVCDENREHLFLQCGYSSQVWGLVLQRFGTPNLTFSSWNNVMLWLLNGSGSREAKLLQKLACQATINCIWRERNCRLHSDISIPPTTLFYQIDRIIRDTLLARRLRKGCTLLLSAWFTHS
ncbi:unnamed protein product [Microthlaspi erraticum]|uniref:Reverse transcriptase zinc-binding domain-containing protein n=1 Tax=Microthlaspi erraticum TaxID=1685480 RepID=A0A6D2KDE7_9BRAS|nr:unnamed protein product [Microthlaspi erraticum]